MPPRRAAHQSASAVGSGLGPPACRARERGAVRQAAFRAAREAVLKIKIKVDVAPLRGRGGTADLRA